MPEDDGIAGVGLDCEVFIERSALCVGAVVAVGGHQLLAHLAHCAVHPAAVGAQSEVIRAIWCSGSALHYISW